MVDGETEFVVATFGVPTAAETGVVTGVGVACWIVGGTGTEDGCGA
jgi:hypothetical protein